MNCWILIGWAMNRPSVFLESLAAGVRSLLQTAPWAQWQTEQTWTKNLAKAVWLRWSQRVEEANRVADLDEFLQTNDESIAVSAEQLVQSKGQELRPEDRYRLQSVLLSARDIVRAHFRRQNEPRGKSTPDWFRPQSPEDLVPILPGGIPFHRPDEPALQGKLQLSRILSLNSWEECWKARVATEVNPGDGPGRAVVLRIFQGEAAKKAMTQNRSILVDSRDKIHFPSTTRLLKANQTDDFAWVIHEYQSGTGIYDLVQEIHHRSSKEVYPRVARWVKRFATLVTKPHTLAPARVHGLLHPDSFLLITDTEEKTAQPALVDWGIGPIALESVIAEGAGVKSSWLPPGHPWFYTSPQIRRGGAPTPNDDVYALGMIWYHMLLNDFSAPPPGDLSWAEELLSKGFQPSHARVISRAISASAERRPHNAAELGLAINELVKKEK